EQDGYRESGDELVEGEHDGVAQEGPEVVAGHEALDVLQADPLGAGDPSDGGEVPEGDLDAVHRPVHEDDDPDDCRQDEEVQLPGLQQSSPERLLPGAL